MDKPTDRIVASEGVPLREALVRALNESEGNMTATARRFGVTRQTVYDWVQREGITIERRTVVT